MSSGREANPAAKRHLLAASLVLCTFLMALGCATRGPAPDPAEGLAGGRDISGLVVDRHGEPVKGADVWLYYDYGPSGLCGRFVGKTKSGRDGSFHFAKAILWEKKEVVEARDWGTPEYSITARHPDHGIAFDVVQEDDPLDAVRVRMYRSYPATLTVKDAEGKPVEGVRVFLNVLRLPDSYKEGVPLHKYYCRFDKDIGICSGTTNARGEVDVEMPYRGRFATEMAGYARSYTESKNAVIFPSARVEGRVTCPGGTPAAGAVVEFEYQGEDLRWSDATRADEDGHYVFADVAATGFRDTWVGAPSQEGVEGRGQIEVTPASLESPYCAKTESFPCNPGEVITQDIALAKGLVFAGKVTNLTTGQPAPNMRFNIYCQTGGRSLERQQMKTDEHGAFKTVIAPGSEITVQWENSFEDNCYLIDWTWQREGNTQPFRGTVTEDMPDLDFEVKLWPVQSLTGRVVTPSGEPAPAGTEVIMHSSLSPIEVDESGAFTLKTAPTDRDFTLYAVSPEKDLAGLVQLEAGATEATITLEPTKTYAGKVTNRGELPANDLAFSLDIRLNDSTPYQCRENLHTDDEGRFTVEHLCPKATYHAWWDSDHDENRDYDYGNVTIDLTELPDGAPITFEARQYLNCMMGKVIDKEGAPIKGAEVEILTTDLVRRDQRWNRTKPLATDEQGEFEIPLLASGEAEIRISAKGYKAVTLTPRTDAIDVEAMLGPLSEGADQVIKVVDQTGKPLKGIPVIVYLASMKAGDTERQLSERRLRTDGQGEVCHHFELAEGQTEGAWCIAGVDIEGYATAYVRLDLDEDSQQTLMLREDGEHWRGRVVDSEGHPIQGAEVKVQAIESPGPQPGRGHAPLCLFDNTPEYSYKTDAQGHFELARFSPEAGVSIDISAPGYVNCGEWLGAGCADDQDKTFHLEAGGQLTGRVTIEGDPEVDWTLCYVLARLPRHYQSIAQCTDEGAFTFPGLRAGTHELSAWFKVEGPRQYVCQERPETTIVPGQTAEVNIALREGIRVRGKAIDKATRHPLAEDVTLSARIGVESVFASSTDEDGVWEMFLFPGTFKLSYRLDAERRRVEAQEITVEEGKPLDGIIVEIEPRSE